MRILAGKYARKALELPPESVTRPTSAKVREAVFNMLRNHIDLEGVTVLDAFAGSGALGLEALSRGAKEAYFSEQNPKAYGVLKRNIQALDVQDCTTTYRADVTRLKPGPYPMDVVFLDPPYDKGWVGKALKALRQSAWIGPKTVVVIEQSSRETLSQPGFQILVEKVYGDTKVVVGRIVDF